MLEVNLALDGHYQSWYNVLWTRGGDSQYAQAWWNLVPAHRSFAADVLHHTLERRQECKCAYGY